MSKNLKAILILSIIGISIFLVKDWQKKKIEFQREKISNGWYKYSNDIVEFEYPKKLRNCYECSVKTGNTYNVMTDGDYIIMTMSNQNSSYLINPKRKFANPKSNRTSEIRFELDSIMLKNNINPTDIFIIDNLQIQEIQLNPESSKMKYAMRLLGEQVFAEITSDELKNCGSESWNYWKLNREGGNMRKFAFGLKSGRFFLKQGNEEIFFEIQKIKRSNLYTFNKENLGAKEIASFFDSIKMKE
jgi:hypothetical protein